MNEIKHEFIKKNNKKVNGKTKKIRTNRTKKIWRNT